VIGAPAPAGLLLAAGAGRRFGSPKALARDTDGTSWLRRSIQVLRDGDCAPVVVVLGAGAGEAQALIHDLPVSIVINDDWESGMGASLRAGLGALADSDAPAALVTLVDLPDVGPEVVRRLLGRSQHPTVLARAGYSAGPGHPVLIGRDHWAGVAAAAAGDRGARDYLSTHPPTLVDCSDLATGCDVDTRA
jgi:CTP:molybdopterin cytidylyltransferase MocA